MQVKQLEGFRSWLDGQTEPAKGIITDRITRIQEGNLGYVKSVGQGLSEVKVDYGPGYRLYCWVRGEVMVILLCGGDKSSQKKDIKKARKLLEEVKNELKAD